MSSALPVHLYNTAARQIEELRPIEPGKIRIYCCGPTVYSYQHVGNLKTYLFEDILVRSLRFAGYDVKHVMNITDVGHLTSDADEGEDKMALAMRREKKRSSEIADFYTAQFFRDCAQLNIIKPDIVCRATDHIPDMIALIERIQKNGFTYISNGNVYFDVTKFANYGSLARLDLEQLKAGARIEVDQNKRGPFDFVLWFTKSKFENQELQWDSPFGRGYPGWHIECSAMSMRHLGEEIDIHCGGIDHIPVHHTNEIAQSEAATGKPWVRLWIHGAFMQINAEKMSKSKGNTILVEDILARGLNPLVYRYLALTTHYRSQLNFTWPVVENAGKALEKLKTSVLSVKEKAAAPASQLTEAGNRFSVEFSAAVRDDLNTPRAMATVAAALNDKLLTPAEKLALLYGFDQVLGLGLAAWAPETVELTPELKDLLDQRRQARDAKDWAAADEIRARLAEKGFVVKDSAAGAVLQRK